jgi:hydrogenase maturation factor
MTPSPEHCITCSDEAVEAVVVAVHGPEAVVQYPDGPERVAIDLVPEAAPGDLLLCHAGIALERIGSQPGRPVDAARRPYAGRQVIP